MTSTPTLALCAAAALGIAQAKTEDVIVVEGTRLDLTAEEAGTSITVLTAEDLEASGAAFVVDALAEAPGVTINQTGAFGGAASVRIRGAGSDQTLVLIDGVPVGDPSAVGGAFDFSRLDTAQIAKIEILRGPQSVLWGSEAIGGVISITTKRAEGGSIGVFGEGGSFGTLRAGTSAGLRNAKGGIRLGASGVSSEGISKADEDAGNTEEDGFDALTLSGGGDVRLLGGTLSGSVLYQTARTEFDSFDFTAPGSIADGDERSDTEELNGHLRFALPANGRGIGHSFLIGRSMIDRENFSGGAPSFDAEGERMIYRYQGTVAIPLNGRIAFGAEHDAREAADDRTTITSGFGLISLRPVDALTLSGGLRHDSHEDFGGETTARVAASLAATPSLTLRANWGQGFKAPSLFQQTFFCCGASAPDAGLEAERSVGYEVGARFARGPVTADVALFALDTDELIDFSFVDGRYVNIARAETRGVEASAEARILPVLAARISYAFIKAEDGSGQDLARVPRHTGDASLEWQPTPRTAASLRLRYNGEEEDNFGTLDDWIRVDANVRFRVTDQAEIFVRGENLTDEDYQQVFGYGTPGRSAFIGLRFRS